MKAARTRSGDKARRRANGDVASPGVRQIAGIATTEIPGGPLRIPDRDWREKLNAQKTIRTPARRDPSVRQVMRQVDLDSTPLRRAFG